MSQICLKSAPTAPAQPRAQAGSHSQPDHRPDRLLLVREALEIAALMKRLHPAFAPALAEIEAEVQRAGQLLLDAGSVARARTALETVHLARLKLQQLDFRAPRFTA